MLEDRGLQTKHKMLVDPINSRAPKLIGVVLVAGFFVLGCSAEDRQWKTEDEEWQSGEIRSATRHLTTYAIRGSDTLRLGTTTYHADHHDDWSLMLFDQVPGEPVVVLGGATLQGSDPLTLRASAVRDRGFLAKIHEWYYLDGSHATESYDWLVMSKGIYTFPSAFWGLPGGAVNAEAGVVEGVDHTPTRVSFARVTYPPGPLFQEPPVVFATQVTDNGHWPTAVRVSNVTVDGFDVYLDEETTGNSNTAHSQETVHFVAFEVGVAILPDHDADGTCMRLSVHTWAADDEWHGTPYLPGSFTFVGLQTDNGGDPAVARKRIQPCSYSTFCQGDVVAVKVDEEGSDGETNHVTESVGIAQFGWGSCASSR